MAKLGTSLIAEDLGIIQGFSLFLSQWWSSGKISANQCNFWLSVPSKKLPKSGEVDVWRGDRQISKNSSARGFCHKNYPSNYFIALKMSTTSDRTLMSSSTTSNQVPMGAEADAKDIGGQGKRERRAKSFCMKSGWGWPPRTLSSRGWFSEAELLKATEKSLAHGSHGGLVREERDVGTDR
ncbi:hypothetical protein V8E54_007821 [Elaphomyces granulatus]